MVCLFCCLALVVLTKARIGIGRPGERWVWNEGESRFFTGFSVEVKKR